jgi:hypothetical protein
MRMRAPERAGKCEVIVAGEGGRKADCTSSGKSTRTEAMTVIFVRRGKCAVSLEVDAVRTKPRGQGVVDPGSALTAEGPARSPSHPTDPIGGR